MINIKDNFRPSFDTPLGIFGGLIYTTLYFFPFRGREPFTLQHRSIFFILNRIVYIDSILQNLIIQD